MSFGEKLRRERELRGVTLVELESSTKINRRYLVALENDQFDQLPGGVFNRGFVRAVARYMKLDENYWIGEFVRASDEEPEILARYAPPQASAPASGTRRVWSVVILLGLFGGATYLVHELRLQRAAEAALRTVVPSYANPTKKTAEPGTPQSGPNLGSSRPEVTASDPTKILDDAEPGEPPLPAAATELRLQIDSLEEAWVTVSVDGQPIYRGLMKAGETRTVRAGRVIELTTGNASAVILTLNGETLPPLGNPGEIKKISLTVKDIAQPLS